MKTQFCLVLLMLVLSIQVAVAIRCWTGQKEMNSNGHWDTYVKELTCEDTDYCTNLTMYKTRYNKTIAEMRCGNSVLDSCNATNMNTCVELEARRALSCCCNTSLCNNVKDRDDLVHNTLLLMTITWFLFSFSMG